jgi:hypothetical protein
MSPEAIAAELDAAERIALFRIASHTSGQSCRRYRKVPIGTSRSIQRLLTPSGTQQKHV